MTYKKRVGTYAGNNGYSRIYYYEYIPDGELCGVLQIVHGMAEYLERYQPFIEFLLSKGLVVVGEDHLGHGRTAAPEGVFTEELGFMGKDGWKHVVEDMHHLVLHMKEKYPQLPYYMLGHSMGSFLTRAYLSKYGQELEGVILSGTAGPNPAVGEVIRMVKGVIKAKGASHRSTMINKLAFGTYNSKFKDHHSAYDWLTRDTKVQDAYIADPLCGFCFTADGFLNLFSLIQYVSSEACFSTTEQAMPLLIVSGAMDPVGGYGKGIQEVQNRYLKAGLQEVTVKLYEDCRHEMHNELNKADYMEDIFRWLEGYEL